MPSESLPQAVHSTIHCGLIEAPKAEDKECLLHHSVFFPSAVGVYQCFKVTTAMSAIDA